MTRPVRPTLKLFRWLQCFNHHLRCLASSRILKVLASIAIIGVYILWVNHETLILSYNPVIIARTDHLTCMLCCDFMLRNEIRSHGRWPEVGRSFTVTAKPLLELRWVEHVNERRGGTLSSQYNLQLSFRINKDSYSLEESTLAPANVSIERAVHEVHEVVLAKLANSNELLARNSTNSHVVQVTDGDPLFDLSW